MTKQFRILALALVLVLSFSTLVGCAVLEDLLNPPAPECEHSWVDANCTTAKSCSKCGATDGEALGHTEATLAAKAPTCTENGLTEGKKCSVCNEIIVAQEEVAMLDHTPGDEKIENEKEATLNSKGSYDKVVRCTVCGNEISRNTVYTAALTGAVADIDGFKYATLEEAIAEAAKTGATVNLRTNFKNAAAIVIESGTVTINFNGCYYEVGSTDNGAALYIGEGAKVTLINSADEYNANCRLTLKAKVAFDAVVWNEGTLIVKNFRLNGSNLIAGGATINNKGSVELQENAVINCNTVSTGLTHSGTGTVTKVADVVR